jgi:hypothetical protein
MWDDEDYESAAESGRLLLGLGDALRLTGAQLLEAAKSKGVINGYTILDDDALLGKGGHWDGTNRIASIPRGTFSGSNSGVARDLYSVAHEVSHALLKHTTSRFRSHVKSAAEKAAPSIVREDRQAERLAIAILSPFRLAQFAPGMTAQEIATRFGISEHAAAIRLEEFSRLYRKAHNIKRPLPGFVIDFQAELHRRRGTPLAKSKQRDVPTISAPNKKNVAIASQVYDDRPCPGCGQYRLVQFGSKFHCAGLECGYAGDLPDGD